MFITKKHLSRRTVLRGAVGAAVGLPFLDAMVPAAHAEPPPQFRFGAIYVPNGVRPEIWTPPPATKLELPPLFTRFAPLKQHVTIVSGLRAAPQSEHHSATSLWLHGGSVRKTEGPDVRSAQTLDQHIVDLQNHVNTRLGVRSFTLDVPFETRQYLLKTGTSAEYGARELNRTIHRLLTQPLATMVATMLVSSASSAAAITTKLGSVAR